MPRSLLAQPPPVVWISYCALCAMPIRVAETKRDSLNVTADCRCAVPRPVLRAAKYALAEIRKVRRG